jgi:hypothetical protein
MHFMNTTSFIPQLRAYAATKKRSRRWARIFASLYAVSWAERVPRDEELIYGSDSPTFLAMQACLFGDLQ